MLTRTLSIVTADTSLQVCAPSCQHLPTGCPSSALSKMANYLSATSEHAAGSNQSASCDSSDRSIWVYNTWNSLSLFYVENSVFHLIWEILCHYLFIYMNIYIHTYIYMYVCMHFDGAVFLSSSSGTSIVIMLEFLLVFHISLRHQPLIFILYKLYSSDYESQSTYLQVCWFFCQVISAIKSF